MNTKAKRVGPFQRTKSEQTVIANHRMTKDARRAPDTESAPYRPTTHEQIVLEKHAARRDATPPAPRLTVQLSLAIGCLKTLRKLDVMASVLSTHLCY